MLFPDALALWLLARLALIERLMNSGKRYAAAALAAKLLGLAILLAVPFVIYIASNPNGYPAVNPDSGGPTGTSQLESSLAIVAILLMLPFGIARRKSAGVKIIIVGWTRPGCGVSAVRRIEPRRHQPSPPRAVPQPWLAFSSGFRSLPLTTRPFEWRKDTRRWRLAFLWWWAALVVTGWVFFLPGVLDHFKFTDGLVGHSFIAMAGFTSSLIIFVMVQLLGDDGWIFNRARSFYLWNGSVIAYIVCDDSSPAGARDSTRPSPSSSGIARNVIYLLRLFTGILMLLASLDWFLDASTLFFEASPRFHPH